MTSLKLFGFHLNSLRSQLLLSFTILVLLSAVAIGLPAIWLIRDQLDRQAWAQVDQGSRAAWALYMARQSEMANLATLTAERPTLRALLAQGDQAAFAAYLQTLQTGAGLDLVLVCNPNGQIVAQAGAAMADNVCAANRPLSFQMVESEGAAPGLWLLASQPVELETGNARAKVVVGAALDNDFAAEMSAETGLAHTLLVDDWPIATSFPDGVAAWNAISTRAEYKNPNPPPQTSFPAPTIARQDTFQLNGQPFYAIRFPLDISSQEGGNQPSGRLQVEAALPVADIAATRQRLVWSLIGGILIVTVLGSILGTVLARRISKPLGRLTRAATRLSQGDLTSPVPTNLRVQEVALLAWALEAARLDLQLTLNDLRREKAWSSHLLESIVEGIVTLDSLGRITFFSHGAERITGWPRDKVIGQRGDEIFRPADTDQPFSQLIPALGRRAKIAVNLPGDRQATLAITGAQLSPEGHATQVALVFRDVSDEELMHRLVGHFLANIAHEFRTPLSALAASVELLLDQALDLNPAELQELLTSLHLGVLGLQTLIDNLLESASIEAGRFRVSPRPTNLAHIIAEVARTLQPLLLKRGQCLKIELPSSLPPVQADPRRTTQVLINLLFNASKYSPDETEITLETSLSLADGWARVTVADQGAGIPAAHRTDLFRRFMYDRAAQDGERAHAGTGLGLSVVKAVVEAQGGQVGVDDRPGGGAIFWFTLPVVEKS
jgi:PAS domain S-box-containing protein